MKLIIMVLLSLLFFMCFRYKKLRDIYNRTKIINNTMINICEKIYDFKDMDELYKQLLIDTINIIDGAQSGSILIYNQNSDKLEYKACIGYDLDKLRTISISKSELHLYKINDLKEAAIIKDIKNYDENNIQRDVFKKLIEFDAMDIESTLSSPIYIDDEFYGIINIDNHSSANSFDRDDIRIINYIRRQLEISIKNVLLINKLNRTLRTDTLTGISNKLHLDELLESEIEYACKNNKIFYVAMIDMDKFKLVNDKFGHKVGDEVLTYFANVLKDHVGVNDNVARMSGDEFVVIIRQEDKEIAEKIIENVQAYLDKNSYKNVYIKFTYGLCKYSKEMDRDKLIILADKNMYEKKRCLKDIDNVYI